MAANNNSSTRPRDRAWLNDGIDRNRALELAFNRIAGDDRTKREELKQACIRFLFVYENFSTNRTLARRELLQQQERIDILNAQADILIDGSSRRRGNPLLDPYPEFMALSQAVSLAERRVISDRALAGVAGYLSRKNIPLNAALRKLVEVAGDCDAEVAALAEALLNQNAQKIDGKAVSKTVEIKASQVRWVRRAAGIVVRRST
jgi:hypothetical protein